MISPNPERPLLKSLPWLTPGLRVTTPSKLVVSATKKELHDMMHGETNKLVELRVQLMKEMEMVSNTLISTEYSEAETFLVKVKTMKNDYQDEIEDFVDKYFEVVDNSELLDQQWSQEVKDIADIVKNHANKIRTKSQEVAAAAKPIQHVLVPMSKREIARLHQQIADIREKIKEDLKKTEVIVLDGEKLKLDKEYIQDCLFKPEPDVNIDKQELIKIDKVAAPTDELIKGSEYVDVARVDLTCTPEDCLEKIIDNQNTIVEYIEKAVSNTSEFDINLELRVRVKKPPDEPGEKLEAAASKKDPEDDEQVSTVASSSLEPDPEPPDIKFGRTFGSDDKVEVNGKINSVGPKLMEEAVENTPEKKLAHQGGLQPVDHDAGPSDAVVKLDVKPDLFVRTETLPDNHGNGKLVVYDKAYRGDMAFLDLPPIWSKKPPDRLDGNLLGFKLVLLVLAFHDEKSHSNPIRLKKPPDRKVVRTVDFVYLLL